MTELPRATEVTALAVNAGPVRFRAWPFTLLCLVLGPAIGLIATDLFFSLSRPRILHPFFGLVRYGESWFFAYLLGGQFAFAAAMIFVLIEKRFGRRDIGIALVSAIIPPIGVGLWYFLRDVFVQGTRLFNLNGTLRMVATCVIAMSVCWAVARLVGVIR